MVRTMNPVLRVVLPTPLGRLVRPFAPADRRVNFDGGAAVTVHVRGHAADHRWGEPTSPSVRGCQSGACPSSSPRDRPGRRRLATGFS